MGGLGLGLAICKSIIEAHGGTIRAQSGGPGCGAMFEVTLRLTQEKIESRVVPAAGRPVASAGLRILLVDDHDDTRVSLKKLLERRGHLVETASTMRQAHELARPGVFQLLISDIGLPDASGHQLMQSLRGDPDLKAIAVSGYGMPADIGRGGLPNALQTASAASAGAQHDDSSTASANRRRRTASRAVTGLSSLAWIGRSCWRPGAESRPRRRAKSCPDRQRPLSGRPAAPPAAKLRAPC